jgi:hypothetical protein
VTAVKLYYDCRTCPVAARRGVFDVTAVRITVMVTVDLDKLERSPQEEIGAPRCPLCMTPAAYGGFDLNTGDGESR